jgi:hypothetical protein
MRTLIKPICGMVLSVVGCVAFAPKANAQAYCALRDPVKMIQMFEPKSSGHRSIVEGVGGAARSGISKRLPFTLHFNELGKHTLYVVLKDDKPVGLVHSRSEKGKWGMVEIVWYLNLDLEVIDYSFQRCRDRQKTVIEGDVFSSQLTGLGFTELLSLLDIEGKALVPGKLKVAADATPLAVTTIRSALKTISVTEIVWAKHLKNLRETADSASVAKPKKVEVLTMKRKLFPGQHHVVPVKKIYTDEVLAILKKLKQSEASIINRNTVSVSKAMNRSNVELGLFVETYCTADKSVVALSWRVDATGSIQAVSPKDGWPSADVKEAFTGLESLTFDRVSNCSTAGQMAAFEILAISKAHLSY